MTRSKKDFGGLLAAAMRLVHRPAAGASEMVSIGDARFRLITEYHDNAGWLVVLMEAPRMSTICEEYLRGYGLTKREIQVARLLADRHSNREIAEQLNVTVHTAGRHTERVFQKLGVGCRRDVRAKVMGERALD